MLDLVLPDRTESCDEQGLVLLPPAGGGGLRRTAQLLVLVSFLLVTTGAALWDALAPPPRQVAMGNEAEALAQRQAQAKVADGSWMRLWDEERTARSNLRLGLGSVYGGLLLREFEKAPYLVVPGKQGWMFMRSRLEPLNGRHFDGSRVWGPRLRAIDRLLDARGIDLHVLVVPRRAWVARDYVRPGTALMPIVDQEAIAGLRARGLSVVDPAPAFDAFGPRSFYREDTHWSREGQYIAAGLALETMGLLLPEDQQPVFDPERRRKNKQGFLNIANIGIGSLGAELLFPPDEERSFFQADLWRPDPEARPELVTVGTSFTGGERFEALLALRSGRALHPAGIPGRLSLHALQIALAKPELADFQGPLLLEVPSYDVTNVALRQGLPWTLAGRADVLRLTPKRALEPLGGFELFNYVFGPQGHVLRIRPQDLALGGDGVAYLRLKRVPSGRKGIVRVRTLQQVYEVTWPGPQEELVVALVDPEDGAQWWQVELAGPMRPSEFLPRESQVVTAHPSRGRATHYPTALEGRAGNWTLRYAFDEPLELDRDHALSIAFASTTGRVRLGLLSAPDAQPVWVTDAHATPLARLLVGLGPDADGTWVGAVLSGTGTLPPPGLGLQLLPPGPRLP